MSKIKNDHLRPGDENARADVHSGIYQAHFDLGPGLVLDLGAHIGFFSEIACGAGATVIAFEPEARNFLRLAARLTRTNCFIHQTAALDENGTAELYLCPDNTGAHSLFEKENRESTPCATLNIGAYCYKLGLHPDFIKIDTEGSEYHILKSLLEHGLACPMAIECHTEELFNHCQNLALSRGHTLVPSGGPVGVCYFK